MSKQLSTADEAACRVPPPLDLGTFRDAMSSFPTGVTIVTTVDESGVAHGLTASSFCSVSLRPPLVSVCVATSANCFPSFARCDHFAVSILRPHHVPLARRFADKSLDKFAAGGFRRGQLGLPVAEDALTVVECRVHDRHPAGDHTIVVGEVLTAYTGQGSPLLFVRRSFTEVAG
ncbi:flavin reductase family protein [Micromonosporaceae bacterium B7E4]